MDKAIMEVLNNEKLETNESRLEAIKKVLATLVIPKDKFNTLSERLQKLEGEKDTLQTEYSDLKTSYDELKQKSMTPEEIKSEEYQQFQKDKELVARQLSEIAIEKILAQSGINAETYGEDEYANLVNDLIADNKENSEVKANNFVNILSKQREFVEKETTSNLLKQTPTPPNGGDNADVVTKEAFDKMTYSQMMNFMQEQPDLYAEYSK